MAQYTREQFLNYYKFEDEPELVPTYFWRYYKSYEKLLKNVKEDTRKGMRIESAIVKNAHVAPSTVTQWKNAVRREISEGKIDTPLIRLFVSANVGDTLFESFVMDQATQLMEEGDSRMIQFVMKNRLGMKATTKKEVEVSATDDFNFNINITDSKELKKED